MRFAVFMAALVLPLSAIAAPVPADSPPASTAIPSGPAAVSPAADGDGNVEFYKRQTYALRAGKLLGSQVKNPKGETIGAISELVFAADGSPAAAILGVGGFLGMGERQIAVTFKSLRFSKDKDGKEQITLNATKETLKSAPEWTWQST